jgi:hypothetical protein
VKARQTAEGSLNKSSAEFAVCSSDWPVLLFADRKVTSGQSPSCEAKEKPPSPNGPGKVVVFEHTEED